MPPKKTSDRIVYLASDHAGLRLKNIIKKYLVEKNIAHKDLGPNSLTPDDDYPDYAKKVAKEISKHPQDAGILICGSGQGMVIAANRFKKVRATLGYMAHAVMVARQDNDSNVLCLAGRFLDATQAIHFVEIFLNSPFSQESRHERRIKKLG